MRPVDERADVGKMPLAMLVPTAGLVAVGLALTVFAGPLLDISERAAANLMDRSVYIEAVLQGCLRSSLALSGATDLETGKYTPMPKDEVQSARKLRDDASKLLPESNRTFQDLDVAVRSIKP